jgi:hypothetical protein
LKKGFTPEPDMTLRDIAAMGDVHPSAMRDILAEQLCRGLAREGI